ncbi:MAG: hypothetical protein K6A15_09045 [Treponema sp.]|nr:hypothetical protein [Treponema sp.]
MSAKKAVIKIGSDVEEAKKGIDLVNKQLETLANKTKKSSFMQIAGNVSTVGRAYETVAKIVRTVNAAIKETTDLYKAQATAERQLEVAAKNNPYLNETSVIQLKSYASELQSISTVGDEQLILMMAQLAAAGRNQTEIQSIMSAALDVSASGMMSLDAAVTALNKTYSGTAGQLGNQISEIKNLTKEELAAGKAVEIVAKQFNGMAKETAELTGTSEQLKNAVGDYKEFLGETFEGAFAPMRKWFTEVITKHNDAKKAAREQKKAVKEVYDEEGNIKEDASESSLYTVWQNTKKELDAARQSLIDYKKENNFDYTNVELWDRYTLDETEHVKRLQTEANKAEHAYREVVAKRVEAEEAAKKEAEAQEEIAKQIEEENNRLEKREKLRKEYTDTIENVEKQIAARRALGERISEEEEAQLLLNAATSEYIKMYSDPAFDRSQTKSGMWAGEQEQRDQITQLSEKVKLSKDVAELKKEADKVAGDAVSFLGEESQSLSQQIKNEISILDEYLKTLDQTGEAYAQLTEKKNQLSELQTEVQKRELEEQAQEAKAKVAEITDVIAGYVDRFAEITNGITSLVRKNNEEETNAAMADLSEQYTNGIISYEEYCEKKKELDNKAAQEEYKLKMWEWTSSFLQATANVAQGIAASLKVGMPAGAILAALSAAAGAVQIATIVANKPKAPSFASGGIVPGNSYSGDRVQANVNSGEMILNAQQQKNLWDMANSKGGGAVVNMPVTIENNMADSASVDTRLTKDGLVILINGIVNQQMQRGAYTESMGVAQAKEGGLNLL